MYVGPAIDDETILDSLPASYCNLLQQCNGYVAYHGGLHVRGACRQPQWHSLRHWWLGDMALHKLFPALAPSDIPFAEDALGDQFVLRGEIVYRLNSETGELISLDVDLPGFDQAVRQDPIGYLSLQPLEVFRANGGTLLPGQLLSVYPPFVSKESAVGVSYRALPAEDRVQWLSGFARQLDSVPPKGS